MYIITDGFPLKLLIVKRIKIQKKMINLSCKSSSCFHTRCQMSACFQLRSVQHPRPLAVRSPREPSRPPPAHFLNKCWNKRTYTVPGDDTDKDNGEVAVAVHGERRADTVAALTAIPMRENPEELISKCGRIKRTCWQ